MEEDGGSPTVTGFIQQNIVGSCSPNILQISWGKFQNFIIYTVNVSTNVVFFRCEQVSTPEETTLVETLCVIKSFEILP